MDISNVKDDYHGKTAELLAVNWGKGPTCPNCGQEMFPEDDHGRFVCFCSLFDGFFGAF